MELELRLRGLALAGTLAAGLAAAVPAPAFGQGTLETVRERGALLCGVQAIHGLAGIDATGRWVGLDADTCRAVALAVFGQAEAVEFVRVTNPTRFSALTQGAVDLLAAGTTWTFLRDTTLGVAFTVTTLYDGQGFMVHRDSGWTRLDQMRNATICVLAQTTSEANLAEFVAAAGGRDLRPLVVQTNQGRLDAFFGRRCDAVTGDRLGLVALRALETASPADYVLLPETISREPLGPLVRSGDVRWFNIVRWSVFALIAAEELGITHDTVESLRASPDPEVRRLLGSEPGLGEALGLDPLWAYRIIRELGHYGEVFARNLGPDTPLGLDRGLNRPWTQGGLMFAPPIR